MADGFNNARAMRVAEIMNDFRNLQYYLSNIQVTPSAQDYYLEGYVMLRSCVAEAQGVLASPYSYTSQHPQGDPEAEKVQLQGVILDASIRRFRCQRAYLRALAALRWVNSRNTHLQSPNPGTSAQLQAADAQLRNELATITNEQVEYSLRSRDAAEGKWLVDDPAMATILQYAGH